MGSKRYESPLFTALLFVIILIGFLATALDPFGLASGHGGTVTFDSLSTLNVVLLAVGLVSLVVGLSVRLAAIAMLRKNFSGRLRIRDGHTLTKNGIYRWVRHPAYLGAILIFLSFPVMLSSPIGFLVMFLLVPYLLFRIKLEERMLIGHFGAEYEDYMRSSKRLIPFLY